MQSQFTDMKRLFFIAAAILTISCHKNDEFNWIKNGIETAEHQVLVMAKELNKPGIHARGLKNGEYIEKKDNQLDQRFLSGKSVVRV